MASLQQIFGWFARGLFPTQDQYKQTFSSFWHRSERLPQTQILGLNDTLNKLEEEKANKEDLANVTAGLVPMGNVANIAELNTKPKRNNDSYFVIDQLSESGDPYIFRYDAELNEWINTSQVVYKNVAKNALFFVGDIKYSIASDINNGATSANVSYDNVQMPIVDEYIISNCVPKHVLFYSGVPSRDTYISYISIIQDENGAYTFKKPENCTYISINFLKADNPNGYTNVSLSGGKRALEDTDRKFLLNLINRYNKAGSVFTQKITLNTAVDHNNGSYPAYNPNYDNLVIEMGKFIGLKGCVPNSVCYYKGEPKKENTLYCRSKFTQDEMGIYVLENPKDSTHMSINFLKSANPNGYENGLLLTGDDASSYVEIKSLLGNIEGAIALPTCVLLDGDYRESMAADWSGGVGTGDIVGNPTYNVFVLSLPKGVKQIHTNGFIPHGYLTYSSTSPSSSSFLEKVIYADSYDAERTIIVNDNVQCIVFNIRKEFNVYLDRTAIVYYPKSFVLNEQISNIDSFKFGSMLKKDFAGDWNNGIVSYNPNYDNLAISVLANSKYYISGVIPSGALFYTEKPIGNATFIKAKHPLHLNAFGFYEIDTPEDCKYIVVNFQKVNNPKGYENAEFLNEQTHISIKSLDIANTALEKLMPKKKIVGIGDSLMQGLNDMVMLRFLQQYVGDGYDIINAGVGGEPILPIGARVGVFPMYIDVEFVLPKDKTAVKICDYGNPLFKSSYDDSVMRPILQGDGALNPIYVYGQLCRLNRVGTIAKPNEIYWTIERVDVADEDITVPQKSLIISNIEQNNRSPQIAIYAMGTNLGYDTIDELVDFHKRFNDFMQTPNFIIIGLHYDSRYSPDNEKRMLKEFGNRYINMREYLATDAMRDVGLEPTQEDLERMAQGFCPYSLQRSKTDQHMNLKGSEAWAISVYNRIVQLNYL